MTKAKKSMNQEEMILKAEAEEIISELTTDLQRVQADFINFRRRADEDRKRALDTGKEQAVLALLPVLDNIERAIAHEPEDIKDHKWVQGVAAIAVQLESQLEAIGLRKIGKENEPFNPSQHNAVAMEDGDGSVELISEVLQPGYQFGDNVIRPAMVRVKRGDIMHEELQEEMPQDTAMYKAFQEQTPAIAQELRVALSPENTIDGIDKIVQVYEKAMADFNVPPDMIDDIYADVLAKSGMKEPDITEAIDQVNEELRSR